MVIWVDLRGALRDGIPFYLSTNRVVLSPGRAGWLSSNYFVNARDLRSGEDLSVPLRSQTRCFQVLDTERDQGGVAGGVAQIQQWRPLVALKASWEHRPAPQEIQWRPLVALKAPWEHRPAPLEIQVVGDEEEFSSPSVEVSPLVVGPTPLSALLPIQGSQLGVHVY